MHCALQPIRLLRTSAFRLASSLGIYDRSLPLTVSRGLRASLYTMQPFRSTLVRLLRRVISSLVGTFHTLLPECGTAHAPTHTLLSSMRVLLRRVAHREHL